MGCIDPNKGRPQAHLLGVGFREEGAMPGSFWDMGSEERSRTRSGVGGAWYLRPLAGAIASGGCSPPRLLKFCGNVVCQPARCVGSGGGGRGSMASWYTLAYTECHTRGKCGMIAAAWTMYDCCGDADAEAEAPPRLTFSPGLAWLTG